MESQTFFVPAYGRLHLQIWLVTDDVIDSFESDGVQEVVKLLLQEVRREAWQKQAFIIFTLNECVGSLAICSD